jgi:hypothetical protein
VLGIRVLRKIFGHKREEVTGKWTTLHNGEHYDPYCSPNLVRVTKSRIIRWVGKVARMGKRRPPPPDFGRGNLREKDHLEGPGRDRLEDNIKMPPQELVGYGNVDWVDLARDGGTGDKALTNAVLNLRVP